MEFCLYCSIKVIGLKSSSILFARWSLVILAQTEPKILHRWVQVVVVFVNVLGWRGVSVKGLYYVQEDLWFSLAEVIL